MAENERPFPFVREFEAFGYKLRVMDPVAKGDNYEVSIYGFRNASPGYLRSRFDFTIPKDELEETEEYYIHLFIRELADHYRFIETVNENSDPWNPWIPNKKAEEKRAEWVRNNAKKAIDGSL